MQIADAQKIEEDENAFGINAQNGCVQFWMALFPIYAKWLESNKNCFISS